MRADGVVAAPGIGWRAAGLVICVGMVVVLGARRLGAEPTREATAAFDADVRALEARLADEHRSRASFLAPEDAGRLQRGELIIEHLTKSPGKELPDALEHDWRGTAFVAGATAVDFERLMQDSEDYPRVFAPEVVQAKVLEREGNGHFVTTMRVKQKHAITVVLDTTYDVTFGRLDAQDGYSLSRSTKIAEIANAGTARERALSPQEDHGFLWRLNTYWSYEERDGGLYMQVESISLTRSIPTGLEWVMGSFVDSVPRGSLEFTLGAVCKALKK